VLACVKDASRRRWRWPSALLDPACARCLDRVRPGRENGPPAEPENDYAKTWKPDNSCATSGGHLYALPTAWPEYWVAKP
jgi:hypothetical protein